MLSCDSGADERICGNSNANFQPKQNIKHGIAQYSVNTNMVFTRSHGCDRVRVIFGEISILLFRFRRSVDTTMTKYVNGLKNEYRFSVVKLIGRRLQHVVEQHGHSCSMQCSGRRAPLSKPQ